MVMGSICIAMSLSKGVPFFLKPASFCFILSGETSFSYFFPHIFSQCLSSHQLFSPSVQVYWSFSLSWYFTSPCWPCCPVITPYLYTMSCPGLWPALAQQELFLLLEVSSSSSSPFLSAPGRNACHTRIAPPSTLILEIFIQCSWSCASGKVLFLWLCLLLAFNLFNKSY